MNKTYLSVIQLMLVLQLIFLGVGYFQLFNRSPTPLIGQAPDQSLSRLPAFDRPDVSTSALLNWATLAATATLSINFAHYEEQLNSLRQHFSKSGYEHFLASINEQGTLNDISEDKLSLSAVAIGSAMILEEEIVNDKHHWQIQVPLLVLYEGPDQNESRNFVIEMLVTQVSTRDAPNGIGITHYVAHNLSSEV